MIWALESFCLSVPRPVCGLVLQQYTVVIYFCDIIAYVDLLSCVFDIHRSVCQATVNVTCAIAVFNSA